MPVVNAPKKYEVDFNDWKNVPSLSTVQIMGGFSKRDHKNYEPRSLKYFYMIEKTTKYGLTTMAYAEDAEGKKYIAWLPVGILDIWMENRNEIKGKMVKFSRTVNVSYEVDSPSERKNIHIDFTDWRDAEKLTPLQILGGKGNNGIVYQPMVLQYFLISPYTNKFERVVASAIGETKEGKRIRAWLPQEFSKMWKEKKLEMKEKYIILKREVKYSYQIV